MPVEGGPTLAGSTLLVGFGQRGVGGGQGGLAALDLSTGQELWRLPAGGNVRDAPVSAEGLAFFTADDARLYALHLAGRKILWRKPAYSKPVPMPASPALAYIRDQLQSVIVGSYDSRFGREPALLTAFDRRGRSRWQQPIAGAVRDTPLLAGGRLFVTAFGQNPSAGLLIALDQHTGASLWEEPFRVAGNRSDRSNHGFVATPTLRGETVYVGSLDHHLYAVAAATGKLQWQVEVAHGITTRIATVNGLLVFADTHGRVYGLDPEQRRVVWTYDLGAPALAHPLVHDDVIFIAGENGRLVALPWHGGQYAWAGEWLQRAGRYDEAGDLWALAAHFDPEQENEHRKRAFRAWDQEGQWQKSAAFWLAMGHKDEAVQALM